MPQALEPQRYTHCDICEAELDESVTAYHPALCDSCDGKEVVFFEQREAIRAQYLREGASNPYSLDDEGGEEEPSTEEVPVEDEDGESEELDYADGDDLLNDDEGRDAAEEEAA